MPYDLGEYYERASAFLVRVGDAIYSATGTRVGLWQWANWH